jgi:hypothetical protein
LQRERQREADAAGGAGDEDGVTPPRTEAFEKLQLLAVLGNERFAQARPAG